MNTPQELFTTLSDETRLRCLHLLCKEREICVCEFSQVLESMQPKISRHLSLLRKSGLVLDKRKGVWVYYRLNHSLELWKRNLLRTILENLGSLEPYLSDSEKLTSLRKKNLCG